MSLHKLDTARPYAKVYGHRRIKYEQDNIPYDAEGNQVLNIDAIILSKAKQPYSTELMAQKALDFKCEKKGLDKNNYKIIEYMGGFVIYDTTK